MCGIAGFTSHLSENEAHDLLVAMNRRLIHRGPDHQGTYVERISANQVLGFGHTLLAIIGKPGEGKQPFRVPGGVIVFNGAIYNHVELRRYLERLGRTFRTQTDTEVLAQGLAEEGLAFLPKCKGMYAFAFWHTVQKKLWLVRDCFGVKPLYYAEHPNGVIFASEYKAILPHLSSVHLDERAVHEFLKLRYVPGEATLIREIRKVPVGTALEFANGAIREIRHYRPTTTTELIDSQEIFGLLRQAISRRAVADVEVAGLLSGGIDSGVVCDFLSREVGSLHTYTLGFQGASFDESARARQISRWIGASNTLIPAGESSLSDLSTLTYHLDDPYGDPIILALHQIFKFISGKQRVLVTGEGSDEIFSGYIHHRVMGLLDRVPTPLLQLGGGLSALAPATLISALFPYSGKMGGKDYATAKQRFERFAKNPQLTTFREIFSLFDETDFNETMSLGAKEPATLAALRRWDLTHWLPDSQLFKLDKISMAASIEAREPFVDVDLVNAVMSLDPQRHFALHSDKALLRKALNGRTRLPPEIVVGRKSSFFQPMSGNHNTRLQTEVRDTVMGHRDFLKTFLNEAALNSMMANESGLLTQKRLFALGALSLWTERIWSLRGTELPIDGTHAYIPERQLAGAGAR